MLALPHQSSPDRERIAQRTHASTHFHQVSEAVASLISHVLAPTSYLQCTSSILTRSPATPDARAVECKPKLVADDEAMWQDEEDGGPLCREATIASWKAGPAKKPKRDIQWLASAIRRHSA